MPNEDYFAKKRRQLGMERADTLALVQAHLETIYPGHCRARQLYRGTLLVVTQSSLVASELRWRQEELLAFARGVDETVIRIQLRIG